MANKRHRPIGVLSPRPDAKLASFVIDNDTHTGFLRFSRVLVPATVTLSLAVLTSDGEIASVTAEVSGGALVTVSLNEVAGDVTAVWPQNPDTFRTEEGGYMRADPFVLP